MPFGHQLKISDRRELYAKLIREYFAIDADNPGILKSWLLGRSQPGAASTNEASIPRRAWNESQENQR